MLHYGMLKKSLSNLRLFFFPFRMTIQTIDILAMISHEFGILTCEHEPLHVTLSIKSKNEMWKFFFDLTPTAFRFSFRVLNQEQIHQQIQRLLPHYAWHICNPCLQVQVFPFLPHHFVVSSSLAF